MSVERCGATTRSGRGCRKSAGWGTEHVGRGRCRLHGGNTRNHRRAAQTAMAAEQVAVYGLPADVDPHDALLEEVHRTAGAVRWIGQIVARLDEGQVTKGITRTVDKPTGRETTAEAALNVWVQLYQAERQHLVRVCKAAIDAGIDERRVQIAEQQAATLVAVLRSTLDDLGVEVTGEVEATVARHLRVIDGGLAS